MNLPEIANTNQGKSLAVSMSDATCSHIHLDHVAAGYELSHRRYNRIKEPWHDVLPEKYLASLRTNENTDRRMLRGVVLSHAVAAIEKPILLRYQRENDGESNDKPTQSLHMLTSKGLLVAAQTHQPDHPNAAEKVDLRTAYFPTHVISVAAEDRQSELIRKTVRLYVVVINQDTSEATAPRANKRFRVRAQPKQYWMTRLRFESPENWGFIEKGDHWVWFPKSREKAEKLLDPNSAIQPRKLKTKNTASRTEVANNE